jgi:hypothetical protein
MINVCGVNMGEMEILVGKPDGSGYLGEVGVNF